MSSAKAKASGKVSYTPQILYAVLHRRPLNHALRALFSSSFFPLFPHSIRPNGWQPQPRSCSSFKASRLSQSWLVSVPPMLLIAVLLEPRHHRKCISHKLSSCKKNTLNEFMHIVCNSTALAHPLRAQSTLRLPIRPTPHALPYLPFLVPPARIFS